MARSIPERSCLACREVKGKGELLRFVSAPDNTLVFDIQAKLPGRGAYTCINRNCLSEAAKRNRFAKAFKGQVVFGSTEELIELVKGRMEERIASYIALANKAGMVVTGSDMVEESIRKTKVGLVIIADDVSEDIGRKIARLAETSKIRCCRLFTKDRFGELVGKGLRSAVAIENGGFVKTIWNEIARLRNFSEEGAH